MTLISKINTVIFLMAIFTLLILLKFQGTVFYKYLFVYPSREVEIEKKFNEEIKNNPEIEVEKFMLWEGDSRVTVSIDERKIIFWYGISGVPRITFIDGYSTDFDCFYVEEDNKKVKYVYSKSLKINSGSNNYFNKWFPFDIDNLNDLVEKNQEIVNQIRTLPINPKLMEFNDKSGKRSILKEPNSDFMIEEYHEGRKVICDLYFSGVDLQSVGMSEY